jgi:hypothetical protein
LVKGNVPPPPKSKAASGGDSNKPKCRTIDECQEMAEKAAREEEELEKANAEPALVSSKGTRYRDLTVGIDSSKTVESGSDIEVYYKVLKNGKRSYDGLGGEGTVVFSRSFGLEDDETKAGDKSFRFTVGDGSVIGALNDAVIGMLVGGHVVLPYCLNRDGNFPIEPVMEDREAVGPVVISKQIMSLYLQLRWLLPKHVLTNPNDPSPPPMPNNNVWHNDSIKL